VLKIHNFFIIPSISVHNPLLSLLVKSERKEVNRMRKGVIISLITVVCLVFVSAVYAHSSRSGHGLCAFQNTDINALEKFQKETLPLRDALITKKFELHREISKEKPDRDRIADIKKEIITIKTEIGKKADEAGLPARTVGKTGCWKKPVGGIIKEKHSPVCF
jgi:hypothetical protein